LVKAKDFQLQLEKEGKSFAEQLAAALDQAAIDSKRADELQTAMKHQVRF
jgi:hypothetical protein